MDKFVYDLLSRHRDRLTRQQMKTLRGQIKAGDTEGAMQGLSKILCMSSIISATAQASGRTMTKQGVRMGEKT